MSKTLLIFEATYNLKQEWDLIATYYNLNIDNIIEVQIKYNRKRHGERGRDMEKEALHGKKAQLSLINK